jgi:D-3-phosphoglycerate dehydrogenase
VLLEAAGWEIAEARCATPEELIDRGAGATALLGSYLPVTRAVLEALPAVAIVATDSVGFENVDIEAASELGVWVTNVPGAATGEVAAHALAMTLALVRQLPFYDRSVRAGEWRLLPGLPRRLEEVTVAAIGLGRIGRRYVELMRPVVGRLVAADPLVPASAWPDGVDRCEVDEAFAAADVVSLHLPLDAATRHLVGERTLALMRPGGYVVNVSRGGLVDPVALLASLDSGRLAGAALDVFDPEPPDPSSPLLHHPRILVTPHVAYLSDASTAAYLVGQAENVLAWQRTGRPLTPVAEPGLGTATR